MFIENSNEEAKKKSKEIHNQNKSTLKPNKKTGESIIKYLERKYPTVEVQSEELEYMVLQNIENNNFYKEKLNNRNPIIKMYIIKDEDKGHELYTKQEEKFERHLIFIGIEIQTSFFFVEGSSYLNDEIIAFSGLDEEDIKNEFLVAQYIQCKEKFKL